MEELIKVRHEKLKRLREEKIEPYPHRYKITHKAREILEKYKNRGRSKGLPGLFSRKDYE